MNKLMQRKHISHTMLATTLIIGVSFALIGIVRMLATQAAVGTVFGEAERSNQSGSYVTHTGDSSASGGGYVTLNTSSQQGCGAGGLCSLSDIQPHATAADCRSAINIDGTVGAYAIPESWLNTHRDLYKNIVTKLCGKVFGSDLHAAIGEHRDGTTVEGKAMADWISNFYIGRYQ